MRLGVWIKSSGAEMGTHVGTLKTHLTKLDSKIPSNTVVLQKHWFTNLGQIYSTLLHSTLISAVHFWATEWGNIMNSSAWINYLARQIFLNTVWIIKFTHFQWLVFIFKITTLGKVKFNFIPFLSRITSLTILFTHFLIPTPFE